MSPLVRFIIFATVFVKGGSFLSLPFFSVYLMKHFGASPAMTGLIVGCNPAANMIIGFYGGYLSDLWGRKGILLTSSLICGFCYLALPTLTSLWEFAILNALLGASYSQIDTLLPQDLRLLKGDEGIRIFSWLLAANSVTVMLGLFPSNLAAKRLGPLHSVIWGQILMSIGFAALAFAEDSVALLMLFMVLLTLGEVLAFANWSMVVDSMAKKGLKGTCFGASGFSHLGHTVGPALGGLLYGGGIRFRVHPAGTRLPVGNCLLLGIQQIP